jgi:arabinose-5-phosphate isomerase
MAFWRKQNMPNTKNNDFRAYAAEVIKTELDAINSLLDKIDENFNNACKQILNCQGRVVVTGMGKSGHIGRKIAATLASTGTPAFFVHSAEASHGDLGMVTKQDVVLAISNSGSTREILTILPIIKRIGAPLISITGNNSSPIAKQSTININLDITLEACPLNLAPTASTTAALVIGDALAIALLKARGFTKEDFALAHPAGRLGRRLLLQISDIMRTNQSIPQVRTKTPLKDALVEMSQKSLGMTAITNNENKMIGIFTDGDLRRALDKGVNVHQTIIDDVMTQKFTTISANNLAIEAFNIMEERKINGFFVVDQKREIIGAFNLHDLLQAGVV